LVSRKEILLVVFESFGCLSTNLAVGVWNGLASQLLLPTAVGRLLHYWGYTDATNAI
jgi:hypothetical protein